MKKKFKLTDLDYCKLCSKDGGCDQEAGWSQ